MTDETTAPDTTYRCKEGHQFTVKNGTWTTFSIDQDGQTHNFNFCMVCFGRWAEGRWPLRPVTEPTP